MGYIAAGLGTERRPHRTWLTNDPGPGIFCVLANLYGVIFRHEATLEFSYKHLYKAADTPADQPVHMPPPPPPQPERYDVEGKQQQQAGSEQKGSRASPKKQPSSSPQRAVASGPADEWTEVVDNETGNRYYVNKATGRTSWELPT